MVKQRVMPKYEVEKIDGEVEREKVIFNRAAGGLKATVAKEDAGYMVYFPRGHSIRVKDRKGLEALGFHLPSPVVNEDGDVVPELEPEPGEVKKMVRKKTKSKAQVNRKPN